MTYKKQNKHVPQMCEHIVNMCEYVARMCEHIVTMYETILKTSENIANVYEFLVKLSFACEAVEISLFLFSTFKKTFHPVKQMDDR